MHLFHNVGMQRQFITNGSITMQNFDINRPINLTLICYLIMGVSFKDLCEFYDF